MRLTLAAFWLNVDLDISFGPAAEDADEVEGAALDGGSLTSQPISFIASHTVPAEADGPWRTPAWDEPEE